MHRHILPGDVREHLCVCVCCVFVFAMISNICNQNSSLKLHEIQKFRERFIVILFTRWFCC